MYFHCLLGSHAHKKTSARHRRRRNTIAMPATERLEPRAMLAVTTFSEPLGINPQENLLQNGSFEANSLPSGRLWAAFQPGQLSGWTVVAPDGVMAEVQRQGLGGWSGTHGSYWLELDGDETGPGVVWNAKEKGRPERGLYAVEQRIDVTANVPYVLRFDFAGRPGRKDGDNQMSYTVVDAAGDTIFSGTTTAENTFSPTPAWKTATTVFTPTTSGLLLVRFEGKGADNTYGMLLDNTVLVKAAVDPNAVDLDIDSDNDNRLLVPDRSPSEESIEMTRGKKVVINENDSDADGVPDYADGYGFAELPQTAQGIANKRFTPVVLQIPRGIPLDDMQVTFSYASSDPAALTAEGALPPGEGKIRLWTKNANVLRNPQSVASPDDAGDFIPDRTRINDLENLGFTKDLRTQVFYVEGVRLSEGEFVPIIVRVTRGNDNELLGEQLVNVVVVSNTIVIGIDGTSSEAWLSKVVDGVRVNERTLPDGSIRWNSHVRNLVADSDQKAMTIYRHGPANALSGSDSAAIFQDVVGAARDLIKDAGGGTTIAIVGWSRGGMIASGVANALLAVDVGDLSRTVAFVGMYDPVDMSNWIPPAWANVHADVKAVTIVGPSTGRQERFNVDYAVEDWQGPARDNPVFVRMALAGRITIGPRTVLQRVLYNASHGAIGGTPGFNRRQVDGSRYDYTIDRRNSIEADRKIRTDLIAVVVNVAPLRNDAWYGFPAQRPPVAYRA
jgi:hypothetical protein